MALIFDKGMDRGVMVSYHIIISIIRDKFAKTATVTFRSYTRKDVRDGDVNQNYGDDWILVIPDEMGSLSYAEAYEIAMNMIPESKAG